MLRRGAIRIGTVVRRGTSLLMLVVQVADPTEVTVPKLWDEELLAHWATPVAGVNAMPSFRSPAEYYAAPVDDTRTYPVYHPDREPPGYLEGLARQGPQPLIEPEKLHTKADWIAAGREVFDGLDFVDFRTDDAAAIAWLRDRDAIEKDPPRMTQEGVFPLYRWVVGADHKVRLTAANCAGCHGRVLDDGTLLRGAPSNLFGPGNLPFNKCVDASDAFIAKIVGTTTRGEEYYRQYGVPWLEHDVHTLYRNAKSDAELGEAGRFATPKTFARFNGSPFWTTRYADLIGIRDHRYLDATGTHVNRGPEDVARYGILVQYADAGSIGKHRFGSAAQRRILGRPTDAAMYALALYLYTLDFPASPHPKDALARDGEDVFKAEKCGDCHTPPLYTNNRLIRVDEFEPPAGDPETQRLHVSERRVGTDPGLALKTRKGTGYYKVPTLRGLWYRDLLEHSGSVATLEEWFDDQRLHDDYQPTGVPRPFAKKRAVPGHEFGLDLSDEEKRALIAFLRTL